MVLRVATLNINGIRAGRRRGFEAWLARREPNVVALQEVRCPVPALPQGVFGGYHLAYDPGVLAGRNGVGVLTRAAPAAVRSWGEPVLLHSPDDDPARAPLLVDASGGVLARAYASSPATGATWRSIWPRRR